MPFYVKDTNTEIRGTIETMEACYPVTKCDDEPWTYVGGCEVFDETAKPKKSAKGETLFLGDDGSEYPESRIEWRED